LERHPESMRLDYKQALERSIADTMVAMANTDGGVIIAGVKEHNQVPTEWPGLLGQDWLDTVANHNAVENTPNVRYEAATVELPENSGRPIMITRIPQSLRRPHISRRSSR